MRAMADYGMFVGDTGGNGFHFLVESGSSSTSFGLQDPWVQFAQRAPGVSELGLGADRKWLFGLDGIDWSRLRSPALRRRRQLLTTAQRPPGPTPLASPGRWLRRGRFACTS